MVTDLEAKIIALIRQKGPLTGSELKGMMHEDGLILWQACKRCKDLFTTQIGTRYMRLDRRIDGFACISPSILREFLSYSVIGLEGQSDAVTRKAQEIASHFEKVSRNKLELANSIVTRIKEQMGSMWEDELQICFIIAGDIVFNMAHDVPRPERSIGKLVNGSDIDLVVVLEDNAPDDLIKSLDHAIYCEKYRLLTSPAFKEEIDYVIKKVCRVKEQLQFDTFRRMIACKILEEGTLLHGSSELFRDIKTMLKEHGVSERLGELEQKAHVFRKNAEEYLLNTEPEKARQESLYLFYPHEESEEFE